MRGHNVRAGKLRHRIDIEQAAETGDGSPNPEYSSLVTGLPAEVMETTGGETIRGRQVEANIRAVIEIRYRSDITPDMRVKYGSRYLNIVSVVDPTGRRRKTILTCSEVQP